jgi:SAM-dependent methyltransferase
MNLVFHERAESAHRILNPLTEEKLALVGEICRLEPALQLLDLACGKAELLCSWAARYGVQGVGVDVSEVFLEAARARAAELTVEAQVELVHGKAEDYQAAPQAFDIVSCIGATWIGGGLVGTLELMKPALKPGGLLLVGEPYWIDPPPSGALEALGFGADEFTSLSGTLDRFEECSTDLVEMVLADGDSWDRYMATQWMTTNTWLREHADEPDAEEFAGRVAAGRRSYLDYGRRYLGWGVFVLRDKAGAQ